jgi:hypothetical protein
MKKVLFLTIIVSGGPLACGPTTGDKGANEDGIQAVDSNGAFRDDTVMQANPSTDTTIGEHRVDISGRDSAK